MPEFVRVLVMRRDDWLVAQCLEYDLATQARSILELFEDLHGMLYAYTTETKERFGVGLEDVPPAPKKFEELWNKAPRLTMVALPEHPNGAG